MRRTRASEISSTQGFINAGRCVNRAAGWPSIPADVPSDHGARVIGERLNRNGHSQTAYGYGHGKNASRTVISDCQARPSPAVRAQNVAYGHACACTAAAAVVYSQSVNLCTRIRGYAQLYSCSVDCAMIRDHRS